MRQGECRAAGRCEGEYRGFCGAGAGVCCLETHRCGGLTNATVSNFQNAEWPGRVAGGAVCSHVVVVQPGTCFVRVGLLTASLQCGADWLGNSFRSDANMRPFNQHPKHCIAA